MVKQIIKTTMIVSMLSLVSDFVFACYFQQYPSSVKPPDQGVVCVVYNFSTWNIKPLLLGESIYPWESGLFALPERVVFPGSNDPFLIASDAIAPGSCRAFCLPIKELCGFKFHVITKRFTKEFRLLDECIKDFTIFAFQQNIVRCSACPGCTDMEEQCFLEFRAFNDERLVHLAKSGVSFANGSFATRCLRLMSQHTPTLGRWLIGRRLIKKLGPTRAHSGRTLRSSIALPVLPVAAVAPRAAHVEMGTDEPMVLPPLPTLIVTGDDSMLPGDVSGPEDDEEIRLRIAGWLSSC